MHYRYNKKGFTALEILISLAILGVVLAITVSTFKLIANHQTISKDTDNIIEALEEARTLTLASQNATQYGVHFTATSTTIFTGSTYTAGTSTNTTVPLSSLTTLTISLTGGGSDIVFQRLTGETTQNGTIVVSSSNTTRTRTVTIYKTGLIE